MAVLYQKYAYFNPLGNAKLSSKAIVPVLSFL
jgi:hypothetical protein